MCPPGCMGAGSSSASGRVDCRTSAKPLVPYTAGRSVLQPGHVDCRTSAKPLVPYTAGRSVLQPPRASPSP